MNGVAACAGECKRRAGVRPWTKATVCGSGAGGSLGVANAACRGDLPLATVRSVSQGSKNSYCDLQLKSTRQLVQSHTACEGKPAHGRGQQLGHCGTYHSPGSVCQALHTTAYNSSTGSCMQSSCMQGCENVQMIRAHPHAWCLPITKLGCHAVAQGVSTPALGACLGMPRDLWCL